MYVLMYFDKCKVIGGGPLQYPESVSIIIADDAKQLVKRDGVEFKKISFDGYPGKVANQALTEFRNRIKEINRVYDRDPNAIIILANKQQYNVLEVSSRMSHVYYTCADTIILNDYMTKSELNINNAQSGAHNVWEMFRAFREHNIIKSVSKKIFDEKDSTEKDDTAINKKSTKFNSDKNPKSTVKGKVDKKARTTTSDILDGMEKEETSKKTNKYKHYCNNNRTNMKSTLCELSKYFGLDEPKFDGDTIRISGISGEWIFNYVGRPIEIYISNKNTKSETKVVKLPVVVASPLEAMVYISQSNINNVRVRISMLKSYSLEGY